MSGKCECGGGRVTLFEVASNLVFLLLVLIFCLRLNDIAERVERIEKAVVPEVSK